MLRRLAVITFAALPLWVAKPAGAAEVAVVADNGSTHAVTVQGDPRRAARRIAQRPGIKAAAPNARARLAGWVPDDPGYPGGEPGGWQALQWNFLGTKAGINAVGAWGIMRAIDREGGRGVTVAVLDTGVAYRNFRGVRASPDFSPRLRQGYDFVAGNRFAVDRHGHGTHVAATIAESVDNGRGLTGIAYGATILPVRVLDSSGFGDAATIARGIRYAARRGADVINVSFVVLPADEPDARAVIGPALRYAQRRGALIVAATGNDGAPRVAYPASAKGVIAVGATTERACQAGYSNYGRRLDLVAPGGGEDAWLTGDPNCRPRKPAGRDILQVSFTGLGTRRFGITGYEGTSMAAPHVSGTAALVISSGLLGKRPTPRQIERRLKRTALDLGPRGYDRRYGWGKVDAAAALIARPRPTSSGR